MAKGAEAPPLQVNEMGNIYFWENTSSHLSEKEHAKTPLHESDFMEHEERQTSIPETTYLYIRYLALQKHELDNLFLAAIR